MAEKRYFPVDAGSIDEAEALLVGSEFHHLVHVIRAKAGQEVTLLDGSGGIYQARVMSIGSNEARLEIVDSSKTESAVAIDLALPAIRAQRLDLAVEKCTEIGFGRLILFSSGRSVWRGGEKEAGRKRERLERKIMAACKQSGQPFFPRIEAITDMSGLLERIPGFGRVYIADDRGSGLEEAAPPPDDSRMLAIVGPEGGFTEVERASLVAAGAVPVSLGSARLRSETAAICLLFALRSYFERKIDSDARR
jgi:16S rRNA (uracil1498-N3)-methyltransferase